MYGVKLRSEGPILQDATPDTLTNFCNGIGDLNPLYRDVQHGRYSRWGSQIGHPCFPYAFGCRVVPVGACRACTAFTP